MLNRYLARVLVTSLTFAMLVGVAAPTTPSPGCRPAPLLYSPRVLRHVRAMLQLRVLEARRARLALAQSAIERQLSIDQLLALPDDAEVVRQALTAGQLSRLHGLSASTCRQP
ncbi:MAG TPA: hypothetical protein VMB20_00180 [Candidatus Acidoferrum sp.]|nr:hypothetical protein [Candidatus Acidoferrum sp.]